MHSYKAHNQMLYGFLRDSRIVDVPNLDQSLVEANQKNIPLEHLLSTKELVDEVVLGRIVADLLGLAFVQLSRVSIPTKILHIIPESFAHKHQAITFSIDKQKLHVAMAHPDEESKAVAFLAKKTGLPVVVHYATEADIDRTLSLYITDLFDSLKKTAELEGTETSGSTVIEMVNMLLNYAFRSKASDIHIEPNQEGALVRLRIDGIMHDILQIPGGTYSHIVTRLKIMAGLRIDEHLLPQDGSMLHDINSDEIDVRVSIVPTTSGENVVLRLLSEKTRKFSLTELGLSQQNLKKIQEAYRKSQGMIIASGPTGSGKTTTMYALLKLLNMSDVSIMTIEDPVEYQIERVRQIQVHVRSGLTFANGLRSILRQDPDIILVGEIRDQETADIAINAALTGHTVLSTLHASDAATALPRIVDMKVEPYLVASSMNIIIAQRLVRTICNNCRTSYTITDQERETLKKLLGIEEVDISAYKGKGCPICFNTGYLGRTGVFEVLEVNKTIQEAITQKEDAATIRNIAIKHGMIPMLQDGIEKVKQGVTTVDEIIGAANQ